MKHLLGLSLLLLFILPALADDDSPEAVVSALYEQHKTQTPFFQAKNRRLLDPWFAQPLADLIWKDAVTSRGEVGAIGADPLYDAQDFKITNFVVHPGETGDDTSLVVVTFDNFGEPQKIVFTLIFANDVWRISDIRYSREHTLLGSLQEAYP